MFQSLEILVKQLNCKDQDIMLSILDMINMSYVWKYRVLGTELLITLGMYTDAYLCPER